MRYMFVTLEVSKASGWLNADAPCRVSCEAVYCWVRGNLTGVGNGGGGGAGGTAGAGAAAAPMTVTLTQREWEMAMETKRDSQLARAAMG